MLHSVFWAWCRRAGVALIILALALGGVGSAPTSAAASSRYFAQTGQSVQGAFLAFFDKQGGLGVFGYPLTGEIVEAGGVVQYFQRARFEWHPQNPDPYKVQLTLLGEWLHGPAAKAATPIKAGPGHVVRYFPETGHNVSNAFLRFWQNNGGLTNFGYPLTEAFMKDGVAYQWFQRARFEFRNGHVRLGNVGEEWLSGRPVAPAAPPSALRSRTFTNQQVVSGAFLDFYERKGGERLFGLPLSGEFTEQGVTVQYFERARFEYRPSNPAGTQVQLGLIGQELFGPAQPPLTNFGTPWNANFQYFPETGHTVTNAFLKFYRENGGLELFGYPLNEATAEGGVIVQWFQRAKMIYRDGRVILDDIGRQRFNPNAEGRFKPDGLFIFVWEANPGVQAIGRGLENGKEVRIAEQEFEGGTLFWRSDTNTYYALYRDTTWAAFGAPGGSGGNTSYNAPPGRTTPTLGMGAMWRALGGPSSKLGWALGPERGAIGLAQRFQFGTMLFSTPQNFTYVLYDATQRWERYENTQPSFVPKQ